MSEKQQPIPQIHFNAEPLIIAYTPADRHQGDNVTIEIAKPTLRITALCTHNEPDTINFIRAIGPKFAEQNTKVTIRTIKPHGTIAIEFDEATDAEAEKAIRGVLNIPNDRAIPLKDPHVPQTSIDHPKCRMASIPNLKPASRTIG